MVRDKGLLNACVSVVRQVNCQRVHVGTPHHFNEYSVWLLTTLLSEKNLWLELPTTKSAKYSQQQAQGMNWGKEDKGRTIVRIRVGENFSLRSISDQQNCTFSSFSLHLTLSLSIPHLAMSAMCWFHIPTKWCWILPHEQLSHSLSLMTHSWAPQ